MTAIPNTTTPTTLQTIDSTSFPYNAVVRITDTIDGYGFQASGVLISPDEVLTADHVSYKQGGINGVATNISVAPSYNNGDEPLGEYTGTVAHYFPVTNDPNITFTDLETDYSIIHLSKPVIGGSVMKVTPDFAGGTVHATGYPVSASGTLVDDVQTITNDPSYAIFDGAALGPGSSGGPVWVYGADGAAEVVAIISSQTGDTSYDMKITAAQATQIAAWVATDDAGLVTTPPAVAPSVTPPVTPPAMPPPISSPVPVSPTTPPVAAPPVSPPLPSPVVQPPAPANPPVSIRDGKTGQVIADTLSRAYAGPVQGLLKEFIDITQQNLIIAANVPGLFVHTGAGDDAIALNSGTNVVDGGGGSNFLTAGTGADTFFVDARNAVADVWSTVSKFHSGDAATVWGISPGTSMQWVDGAGAAGFTGLTLHAGGAGGPTSSVTLAGLSRADIASGKLSATFGHDAASGSDYLYVHAA